MFKLIFGLIRTGFGIGAAGGGIRNGVEAPESVRGGGNRALHGYLTRVDSGIKRRVSARAALLAVAVCCVPAMALGAQEYDPSLRAEYERRSRSEFLEVPRLIIDEGEVEPLDFRLTVFQICSLNAEEQRLLRNTIFARRGYEFSDGALSAHFSRFGWYEPRGKDVSLNAVDEANTDLIRRFETGAYVDGTRVSRDALLGVWHADPVVSAGWNQRLFLYPDGRFVWNRSEYAAGSRLLAIVGSWSTDGTQLLLDTTNVTTMEGGSVGPPAPFETAEYVVADARTVSTGVAGGLMIRLPISEPGALETGTDRIQSYRFGGMRLYRISNDASLCEPEWGYEEPYEEDLSASAEPEMVIWSRIFQEQKIYMDSRPADVLYSKIVHLSGEAPPRWTTDSTYDTGQFRTVQVVEQYHGAGGAGSFIVRLYDRGTASRWGESAQYYFDGDGKIALVRREVLSPDFSYSAGSTELYTSTGEQLRPPAYFIEYLEEDDPARRVVTVGADDERRLHSRLPGYVASAADLFDRLAVPETMRVELRAAHRGN